MIVRMLYPLMAALLVANAVSAGEGSPSSSYELPPVNPFLSQGLPAVTHQDSGASDAVEFPGPNEHSRAGENRIKRISTGLLTINYAGLLRYPNGIEATWNTNNNRVTKIRVDGDHWEELASLPIEGMNYLAPDEIDAHLSAFDSFDNLSELKSYLSENLPFYAEREGREAGIYSLTDNRGEFYVLTRQGIFVYGQADASDPYSDIVLLRQWKIPPAMKRDAESRALLAQRLENIGVEITAEVEQGLSMLKDFPLGINMTYDGHIAFSMIGGTVGVIDRDFKEPAQTISVEGELFANSLSLDPDGGLYAVSDRRLHKFVWRDGTLSDSTEAGAWSAPYSLSESPIPGVRGGGTGSGTTATLLGFGPDEDHLVVIADGMEKMNLVAFWRDDIPADAKPPKGALSPRIADQIAVTAGGVESHYIQTEASIAIADSHVFLLNGMAPENIKPDLDNLLAQGPYLEPPKGIEMFRWDHGAHQWQRAWANSSISTPSSIIPVMSTVTRQVYVLGWDAAGWSLLGYDFSSGKEETRITLGHSKKFNGAWGVLGLFPNGDVFIPGVTGPIRLLAD